jgi:hypothetical protein
MIFDDPSDAVLINADVINLLDPEHPDWRETIVGSDDEDRSLKTLVVVDIRIDSTDCMAVEHWRAHIAQVHPSAARETRV